MYHPCSLIRLDDSVSQEYLQRLRKLPVFPLLASTKDGSAVTNWTAIPLGHSIRSVGWPRFVPVIDMVSFVGLDGIAPALVKFVEPSHPNPMSENDLVEIAVENFTTQPEHLQLALLRHITAHRNRIIQDIIEKRLLFLRKTVYDMFPVKSWTPSSSPIKEWFQPGDR